MANYPSSLAQERTSREQWKDPMEIDYARSGSVKGRRAQASKKRVFTVEHRLLTNAERSTLESFYDTNRGVELNFAWNDTPGTTYSVIFSDENGLDFKRSGNDRWDVAVKLSEV